MIIGSLEAPFVPLDGLITTGPADYRPDGDGRDATDPRTARPPFHLRAPRRARRLTGSRTADDVVRSGSPRGHRGAAPARRRAPHSPGQGHGAHPDGLPVLGDSHAVPGPGQRPHLFREL